MRNKFVSTHVCLSLQIKTYLNGCDQAPVSMKFPSRVIQSNCKLMAMVGHCVKENKINTSDLTKLDTSLLITNLMIFQGEPDNTALV